VVGSGGGSGVGEEVEEVEEGKEVVICILPLMSQGCVKKYIQIRIWVNNTFFLKGREVSIE